MNYHHSPLTRWRLAPTLLSAAVLIIVFSVTSAKAQRSDSDSRYGVSLGTDYDVPVGNFAYTFKPAINYNLNLFQRVDHLTGSISFGYHKYKPKQDVFYYQVSDTEYGTVKYQDFPAFSFYLGLTYDLPLGERINLHAGINLGAYYTHLVFLADDYLGGEHDDLHERDVYLAPRLGFTYTLTDSIDIGMEGKYNFFAPGGHSEYGDRVGTLYNSYSAGVRLIYNF